MTVRETRTLDFNGSFTRVYWYLDERQSGGITVTGVSGPQGPLQLTSDDVTRVPGRYAVTDVGGRLFVQAFFALQDTQATFVLDYTVKAAAQKWADTSELYWQFVGDRVGRADRHGRRAHRAAARREPQRGAGMGARAAQRTGDDQERRQRATACDRRAGQPVRRGAAALPAGGLAAGRRQGGRARGRRPCRRGPAGRAANAERTHAAGRPWLAWALDGDRALAGGLRGRRLPVPPVRARAQAAVRRASTSATFPTRSSRRPPSGRCGAWAM